MKQRKRNVQSNRVLRWIAGGLLLVGALVWSLQAQPHRYRTPIPFPNIPGYITLKCDFHMHTVFSDGTVWPTIRVEEAWREGLDAIALTDHLEYHPHRSDVSTDQNRPYELAKPLGDQLHIIVIRGAEITRQMPPGHLNALFLTDANALQVKDWRDAVQAAKAQHAFILWNHPGWKAQQPDGIPRWYKEHTWLLKEGMLHGIEVANHRDLYPKAFQWALEKGLAPMANSDLHLPSNLDFDLEHHDHRPMTLVFARSRSKGDLKAALFAGRTVAYFQDMLLGQEKFLKPLFHNSIWVINPEITIRGRQQVYVQIHNRSPVDYVLHWTGPTPKSLQVPKELRLVSGKTVLMNLRGTGAAKTGTQQLTLTYQVTNLWVAPYKPLKIQIPLRVTFQR